MNVCTLGYLPPPTWGCSKAFKANLDKHPTKYPLVLYSDHPYGEPVIQLRGTPEKVKDAKLPNGQPNKFAISNLTFLTAVTIAQRRGIDFFIYLEADCRVGKPGWDEIMFDEFFSIGHPCIVGGSLAVYNPCAYSSEAARRWGSLVARNTKRNFPVPTYGWMPAANRGPSCVFANGALAVYDVAWMAKMFELETAAQTAATGTAYDMAIGEKIWSLFKEDAYNVVGFMDTAFSGYGDVLSTEDERLGWLRDGRYAAVHQVKNTTI